MKWFICWFLGHNWTSKPMQGIDPTKAEIEGGVMGFQQYAKLYCSRCEHVSKLTMAPKQKVA